MESKAASRGASIAFSISSLIGNLEDFTASSRAAQALIKELHREHYDEYGTDDGFFPYLSIKLRSDSQLCLGWASGRYKHKSEDRQRTVALLQDLFNKLNAEASWVKGHSKHEWNDRADALAHFGRTGEFKRKKDKIARG